MYSTSCYHSIPDYFFFNDTATTEIYTLSLHDALPTSSRPGMRSTIVVAAASPSGTSSVALAPNRSTAAVSASIPACGDRKSTRLNSSHLGISYAVFCLKKKTLNKYHFLAHTAHICFLL